MAQKNIIIICGEASGDLNASCLAREILRICPRVNIYAVGGKQLKEAGANILCDIKELSVLGFFGAVRMLPKFLALKKFLLGKIRDLKPEAVILVDFSGFNLRLARKINNSARAIYYISPQVWASRQGRIKTIRKYISKLIVLFEFEAHFYKRFGIEAQFCGHPLLDIAALLMKKEELFKLLMFSRQKKTIALLPGSRRQEVSKILPVMLASCKLIDSKESSQFVIAKSPNVSQDIYDKAIAGCGLDLKILEGKTCDCLNIADYALVASGTATLEAAIIGVPFAIIYKMGLPNYLLYRPLVRVPYIGIVNIVAGKKIVPEFIQFGAQPKKIAEEALLTLKDTNRANLIKSALAEFKPMLGEPGAARRAAQTIANFLSL